MPPKPDVRRLLKKQQLERNKVNKITHPFAKYDEAGRLVCVVCNAPVKSEAVWQAHLGSSAHRDNIQKLKALKQQQLKRRAPSPPAADLSASDPHKRMRMEEDKEDKEDIELDEDVSDEDEDMGLPNDFFDNPADQDDIPEEVPEKIEDDTNNTLPAGFFDDPEEDARIQGTLAPEEQSQVDLEKDIAMFNEAMIEVTKESREVQEEDDETFWVERHFDISQEQAAFDSRVQKLKQLRQGQDVSTIADQRQETIIEDGDDSIRTGLKSSVRQILKNKPAKKVESMFDDEEEESDDEEEEDWRAQQL